MSLILDALRKSEAERQRGQAPNLYAGIPAPVRRRAPPAWLWPALAIAVLAALLLWQLWPRTEPTAAPFPRPSASASVGTATAPKPAPSQPAIAAQPAAAVSTPAPPLIVAAPPAPMAKPATELPTAQPTPPATSESQAATADASDDDSALLPRLADMPSETRAVLPPLKLSMHVWSERPEGRFAIIDGQRVGEGSRVGAAVVQEIRRNGVVLDIDGRAYWLPRP